jgi:hypothetical protein
MMLHELHEKQEELKEIAALASNVPRIPARRYDALHPTLHTTERLVYFVRHGEGVHNVFAAHWREEGKSGIPVSRDKVDDANDV